MALCVGYGYYVCGHVCDCDHDHVYYCDDGIYCDDYGYVYNCGSDSSCRDNDHNMAHVFYCGSNDMYVDYSNNEYCCVQCNGNIALCNSCQSVLKLYRFPYSQ